MEGYIAEIRIFAGTFAPAGWAFCNGQIMSITQNTALFSLLGTTYGGNGQTTFALPNLQGRVPMGVGQGPGLSNTIIGQVKGSEAETLTIMQIPQHNHGTNVPINGLRLMANAVGSEIDPTESRYLASIVEADSDIEYLGYSNSSPDTKLASESLDTSGVSLSLSGGSQPHQNLQPYLALNYIICLEGIFPSRN